MKIIRYAEAGTDGKEDLKVAIYPAAEGYEILVNSTVKSLYGKLIEKSAREVLTALNVEACRLEIDDRSALDFAVRARVETAVRRGAEA